ncbi:MAG: CPBP family intramembrane glutamic endopeptidase [Thermoleophilia bacterium]
MDQPQEPSAPAPGEDEITGASAPEPGGSEAPAPTPGEGSWDLLSDEPGEHRQAPRQFGRPPGAPAGRRPTVPWTARDVFIIVGLTVASLILAFFLIQVILAVVVSIRPDFDTKTLADSDLVTLLLLAVQWAVTLGVAFAYLSRKGYKLTPWVLGFRKTRPGRAIVLLALILVANSIFGILYGDLIDTLAGPDQLPSNVPAQNVTNLFGTSAFAIILTFIAVALLTPVIEELFFRGIIHRGLEQRFGFLPGATMSSAIFALAHVDYRLYVPIFVLGFGFAYLVHKTGSIWPSIGGHFVINFLGVIAQFTSLGN